MQQDSTFMTRRSRLGWVLLGLGLLLAAGWYLSGRSEAPAQLERLDREWALVLEEARPLLLEDGVGDAELERLLLRAEELGSSELSQQRSQTDALAEIDMASLDPELLLILERIAQELDAGRVRLDLPGGKNGAFRLLACFKALANAQDLDVQGMQRLMRCSRRFQREGGLTAAALGSVLCRELLDRIEANPSLSAGLASIEAPQPEELYASMLRDQIALASSLPPEEGGAAWQSRADELGPAARGMRLAVIAEALRHRSLAAEPERFETLPAPKVPGTGSLFLLGLIPTSSRFAAVASPLIAVDLGAQGKQWSLLIERWQRLAPSAR